MFISDTLIEIGQNSNPKNNLSMAEASSKMEKVITQYMKQNPDIPMKCIMSRVKFACEKLNERGYPFSK